MKYQLGLVDAKNEEWVRVWKEAVMVYFRLYLVNTSLEFHCYSNLLR
jgi:hypothetical protein